MVLCVIYLPLIIIYFAIRHFKTLSRVYIRKDFWDCYWGQGKQIGQ